AGAGILHEEFHSESFTRSGGLLEMVQLWVNLPAARKMTPPKYQAIQNHLIPEIALPGGAGTARVIAGSFGGAEGPAKTFTPMRVLDIRLSAGRSRIDIFAGWNALLTVLDGKILINDDRPANGAQLVILDRAGSRVEIEAEGEARLLLLAGEPIDEPVAGYGPFVMNTRDEISQALEDFKSGRFGKISALA
ncbi:MAG: pirin family protein, partial [Gammaproteobacteria bacterium]